MYLPNVPNDVEQYEQLALIYLYDEKENDDDEELLKLPPRLPEYLAPRFLEN